MTRKEARQRFSQQRAGAKRRGIEWRLTFDQWLEWWGDDLDRRGRASWQLQMQRFHDRGAYELGNIRKGTPADNSRTAASVRLARESNQRAVAYQASLDDLPYAADEDDDVDWDDLPISEAFSRAGSIRSSAHLETVFVREKHRR